MKINKETIGEIITMIGAILLLGDLFNFFPPLRNIVDPLIWSYFNMLVLFLGISLTIKRKKIFYIYWILVVILLLIIYSFYVSLFNTV